MRLRGKGFAKNELLTLEIGTVSINIDQRIISDKDGEFTTDIKIPRIVGGTKEITATGTSGDVASTTFTITAQLLSINGFPIYNTIKIQNFRACGALNPRLVF